MVMSSMRIPSNRVSENQSKRMNNSAYHIILFHAAIELVKSLCYECMQSRSKAPCTLILLFPHKIFNSLTVNHTILMMSVQRIWYWIDKLSPN